MSEDRRGDMYLEFGTKKLPKQSIAGYEVEGRRYYLASPVPSAEATRIDLFVQRSTMRGRPWLRFFQAIADLQPRFWVTAYKTKREAVLGI